MARTNWQNLPNTTTPLNAANLKADYDDLVEGSGWITLPLATGIEQYANASRYRCQYRKIGNQVFVVGCIKGVTANNTTIATLPTGYRPSETARYVTGGNSVKGNAILSYDTAGNIIFVGYTINTTPTSSDYVYIQTSFFVD